MADQGNIFLRKGFQGTEKSAFDIFRDICTDKNDDIFPQNFEDFGMSEKAKSDVKSFFNSSIFATEEEDESQDFFKSYKPTFSDPTFMQAPTFPTEGSINCTTSFFSVFFAESGDNSTSKTSTTFYENVKIEESYQSNNAKGTSRKREGFGYGCKTSNASNNMKSNFYDFAFLNDVLIIDEEIDSNFEFYADSGASTGCSLDDLERDFTNDLNIKCKLSSPSKKIYKMRDSLNLKGSRKRPSKKCKY